MDVVMSDEDAIKLLRSLARQSMDAEAERGDIRISGNVMPFRRMVDSPARLTADLVNWLLEVHA